MPPERDSTRTTDGRSESTKPPQPNELSRHSTTQDEGSQSRDLRATLRWVWTTDSGWVAFVREILTSALAVLLVGGLLFMISGVWPPLVAVESGSMEPNLHRGDLVFLMDEHRLVPRAAYGNTGVVTYRDGKGTGYVRFGDYGDVIVFTSAATPRTAVIHRARFWVNEGENWFPRASEEFLPNGARSCKSLSNCPAPTSGFITKGDANAHYDQAIGISPPIRPRWIRGTAELSVPWLGHVRLFLSELAASTPAELPSTPPFQVERI